MAFGLLEILSVGGLFVFLIAFSKKYVKEAKMRKYAKYAGGALIGIGLLFGGYAFAGVPGLLSFAAAPAGPAGGALWDAIWDTATSDTDRTEAQEILAKDQRTITYTMTDANADGLGDVNMGAVLVNKNTDGNADSRYAVTVEIAFVGTILVSNVATPLANFTADRSRYNIAYSEDAGPGTWTQIFDRFESGDQTMGSSTTLSIDMPVDPAVANDLPAGGTVELHYTVGGILLKVIILES